MGIKFPYGEIIENIVAIINKFDTILLASEETTLEDVMGKNEEGVGVIVTKGGEVKTNVVTEVIHIKACMRLIGDDKFHGASWTPLKKLGLCQEYYK